MTQDSYYQQIDKDKVLLHFSINSNDPTLLEGFKNSYDQDSLPSNELEFDSVRELHGEIELVPGLDGGVEFPLEKIETLLTNREPGRAINVETIEILQRGLPEEGKPNVIKFSMKSKKNVPITEEKIQTILEKAFENDPNYNIIDVYVPPWSETEEDIITLPPEPTEVAATAPPAKDLYVGRFLIDGMNMNTILDVYNNVDNSKVGQLIQNKLGVKTPSVNVEYYEYKDEGEMYGHFVIGPVSNEPTIKSVFDDSNDFPSGADFDRFQPIDLKNQREFIGNYTLPGDGSNLNQKQLKERLENFFTNSIKIVFLRDEVQQCSFMRDDYFCLKLDGSGVGDGIFKPGNLVEFGVITQPNEHLTHQMINQKKIDPNQILGSLSNVRPYGPDDGSIVSGYTTISVISDEITNQANRIEEVEMGLEESIRNALGKANLPGIFRTSGGFESHPEASKLDQKYRNRVKFEIRLPPTGKTGSSRKKYFMPKEKLDNLFDDFKEKVNEEISNNEKGKIQDGQGNEMVEYIYLSEGLFFDKHDPCQSPFINVCALLDAKCLSQKQWNGLSILGDEISCECKEGFEESGSSDDLRGRYCMKKDPVDKGPDGPLIGMIVAIIVLFLVILILSYFVHKKRTRQKNYNPRMAGR